MSPPLADNAIPLLDLGRFDAGATQRAAFLAELRAAARDVGFFYLTGHGVEPALLGDLLEFSRRFFCPARSRQARRRNGELAAFFAAITGSPGSSPGARRTGASRSTLARSVRPCHVSPANPPGRACRARTSGQRRCRSYDLSFYGGSKPRWRFSPACCAPLHCRSDSRRTRSSRSTAMSRTTW